MTLRPASTTFDINEIPFSFSGSWLNLSPVTALHTVSDAVHLVSHRNGMHAVLRLEPAHDDGTVVASEWHARPSVFAWQGGHGRVEAAYAGRDTLRLRGEGLSFVISDAAPGLTPFTGTYLFTDPVDGAVVFTSYETGSRYRITTLRGQVQVTGNEALGKAGRHVVISGKKGWEIALQETTSAGSPAGSQLPFDEVRAAAEATFQEFVEAVAPWRDEQTVAAELAAYVLWSATVAPAGFVRRESILMSKHWMDKLWSWDHCFNALAVAPGLADLAIDQLLAPFDHQDDSGALPDSITHSEVLYNYVKPPIHGWALRRLRSTAGRALSRPELELFHDKISRSTRYWLEHRRAPGHALPHYQHGNDSGWDNSTTFDRDRVIESPDLASFLILQLETLMDLSEELGRPAEEWKSARDTTLQALMRELWTGEAFVGVGALSGRPSSTTSLLNLLPLLLGERLPGEVRSTMAANLLGHLTEHGPATEPTSSARYQDDGYWRGPIWAPSTALIADGLTASGFPELAESVRSRFMALCERSGFAENFNATTGEGLRDRAYTWTAAVYLIFAAERAGRPGAGY